MNKNEFCEALRVHIAKKHRRQAAAARAWGVSESYVSQVLSGNRAPTDVMLKESGFELVPAEVKYKRVKPTNKGQNK